MSTRVGTTQVYRVYIRATREEVWQALTAPEWTTRYGYRGVYEYDPDLRTGASYRALADSDMQAAGMPEVVITGEVIEADPPRKLVQTWQAQWPPVEAPTRLTYELADSGPGVVSLTVTHELADAPGVAAMVGGELEEQGVGGGWDQVLSDLKSLLETGEPLYS